MDLNWRLVAIFAGGAFLLSVFSALIAGVTFGALILRAVLGAAVFGGLALLIQLVIDRYLPELKEGAPGESQAASSAAHAATGGTESTEPSAGGNVDIVVEEEPEELDTVDDDEDDEAFGQVEGGESGNGEGNREEVGEGEEPAAGASPDAETEARSYQYESRENGGDDQDGVDELIEEVEEVGSEDGSVQDTTNATRHDRATADVTPDDIDRLPDIGGFSDSFGDEEESSPQGGTAAGGSPSGSQEASGLSSLDGAGSSSTDSRSDQDPETIARAIQTVLRRE